MTEVETQIKSQEEEASEEQRLLRIVDDFQLVLTLLSDWKEIENGNISGTFEENEDGNCDETEAMDVEIIDGLPFETRPHIFKIPSMTNPPLPRSK